MKAKRSPEFQRVVELFKLLAQIDARRKHEAVRLHRCADYQGVVHA